MMGATRVPRMLMACIIFGVREGGDAHLEGEAGDAAEGLR